VFQQVTENQPVFVWGFVAITFNSPVSNQFFCLINTKGHSGIADIKGHDHLFLLSAHYTFPV